MTDRPDPRTTPRIAYFITSYGPGDQLLRLVRALRAGDPASEIVVHHDELHHAVDAAPLEALGVHVLRSEEPIVWGDMTLERARWRVFRWVLAHLDVDWVMLLSEQDYPIAPLDTLRARLTGTSADAVVEAIRVDDETDPERRRDLEQRYYYRYTSFRPLGIERRMPAAIRRRMPHLRGLLFAGIGRVQRTVSVYMTPEGLGLPSRIGLRVRRSPFGPGFPAWYNSCWCALSRRAIEHVVAYVDTNPAFVRYYEHTVIPVESATATIICNDPDLRIENASLHAIRWSDPRSGRPDEFGLDDLAYLDAAGVPFARKFGRDTRVLDALDARVLADSREAS